MSFKIFRDLEPEEFIVVGCDTAIGGNDYSAAQFISKTHMDVPIVYHSKKSTTAMTNALAPALDKIFDITGVKPIVAYERNNGGAFELERLASLNRLYKYEMYVEKNNPATFNDNEPSRYGWTTSSSTRPKMLEDLKVAVDDRLIRVYDELTVQEMYSFIVNQKSNSWKAEAERGSHDDLLMSLAVAYQLFLTEEKPKRYDFFINTKNNFDDWRI